MNGLFFVVQNHPFPSLLARWSAWDAAMAHTATRNFCRQYVHFPEIIPDATDASA
ncbi:hypothetical protein [Sphaerisporangium dianthi]|uniref:Uncharacterized protein n=1 Tax=Sphaerisporangium dianthi TaxID=1436120 RepID=A0ABV9CQ93_9ACTN